MVVRAMRMVLLQPHHPLLLHGLLERPAEAITAILVHGLNHEQHTAKLEDRGTDKGRDASRIGDLAVEFGGGVNEWEPDEKGIDDPDDGTYGEHDGDEIGDVPVGVFGEHAADAFEAGLDTGGRGRGDVFRVVIRLGRDGDSMTACNSISSV